jgi:hypothetical protein
VSLCGPSDPVISRRNRRASWPDPALLKALGPLIGASFPWWVIGGFALELYAHASWRCHEDVDIAFPCFSAEVARTFVESSLSPITQDGRGDGPDRQPTPSLNGLRWATVAPLTVHTMISPGDDYAWVYRRDPAVRVPWREAILRCGLHPVPFLAPELVLLLKSRRMSQLDRVDFDHIGPLLPAGERRKLMGLIPPDHEWQRYLANGL